MKINEVIRLGKVDNSRALAYIDELYDVSQPHPFDNRKMILGGSIIHVSPTRNNEIHLHDIQTMEPRKGHATQAMKTLMAMADKHNVDIELIAKAYHHDSNYITDTEDLVGWYERLGFQIENGSDDYGYGDGVEMKYYAR